MGRNNGAEKFFPPDNWFGTNRYLQQPPRENRNATPERQRVGWQKSFLDRALSEPVHFFPMQIWFGQDPPHLNKGSCEPRRVDGGGQRFVFHSCTGRPSDEWRALRLGVPQGSHARPLSPAFGREVSRKSCEEFSIRLLESSYAVAELSWFLHSERYLMVCLKLRMVWTKYRVLVCALGKCLY